MKAISTFQPGNYIQISKYAYKGAHQTTIISIENNQIKFRSTNGKAEAEGIIDKDAIFGVVLLEKHLETFKFKITNINPIEYAHSEHVSFKLQIIDKVVTYKDISLLYVHQLQNLYFAITGNALS